MNINIYESSNISVCRGDSNVTSSAYLHKKLIIDNGAKSGNSIVLQLSCVSTFLFICLVWKQINKGLRTSTDYVVLIFRSKRRRRCWTGWQAGSSTSNCSTFLGAECRPGLVCHAAPFRSNYDDRNYRSHQYIGEICWRLVKKRCRYCLLQNRT